MSRAFSLNAPIEFAIEAQNYMQSQAYAKIKQQIYEAFTMPTFPVEARAKRMSNQIRTDLDRELYAVMTDKPHEQPRLSARILWRL